MSDLASQLQQELIDLNEAARKAAHTAMLLNHSQAEALRMVAAFTERLVKEDGTERNRRH